MPMGAALQNPNKSLFSLAKWPGKRQPHKIENFKKLAASTLDKHYGENYSSYTSEGQMGSLWAHAQQVITRFPSCFPSG